MTDQTQNNTDALFEPTEKIEIFLLGFLHFGQILLCTLRDLAFNQTKFSNTIKNHNINKKYTKPVTFITLISFFAIRIFRLGVLFILLAISVPSCRGETYTEIKYPSLLDELKVPAVTEIILYGIPTLIVVLLLSQLLKMLLLNGSDESKKTLVSITYYSVGFQYIAYLIMFSLISLIFHFDVLEDFGVPSDFIYLIPLLFLPWVISVFYRLVSKSISKDDFRVSRFGFRQIWLFIWSLVLIAITTMSGVGIAYSLAELDFRDSQPQPKVSMGLVGFDTSEMGSFSFDLLVKNNSNEEIAMISNQVTAYGLLKYQGEITNSSFGQGPVFILESNEVGWLTLSFDKPGTEYPPRMFFAEKNLIDFATLRPSGGKETILAYIRADGEIVEISVFE